MWSVSDCPAHPSCALEFRSGVLCLACGQRVVDTLAGRERVPAPPELRADAKAAWQVNQGVRDFTESARAKYPQTGDDDGLEA